MMEKRMKKAHKAWAILQAHYFLGIVTSLLVFHNPPIDVFEHVDMQSMVGGIGFQGSVDASSVQQTKIFFGNA